jgi:hypothetical protein
VSVASITGNGYIDLHASDLIDFSTIMTIEHQKVLTQEEETKLKNFIREIIKELLTR